jgi:hypothetical protein
MTDLSDLRGEIGSDLYPYVKLVHQAPSIDGATFNPVALIRAVNGLQSLGKERAVAVLRTYDKVATANANRREKYGLDEQRIFLILRLLFVPEDAASGVPPMLIGEADPPPPQGDHTWPLFPLVVVDQIPFLPVSGYGFLMGGLPQSPLDHVVYCAQRCRLRDEPLVPETSPIKAVESLLASEQWERFVPPDRAEWFEGMLRRQALRALAPLYTVPEGDSMAEWRRFVKEIAELEPCWDPAKQQFVAGNETS